MSRNEDILKAHVEPVSAMEPPSSYDLEQTQHFPKENQTNAPEALPVLVLDDCKIYSIFAPGRILYELSNPPCEATRTVYGIEKIRYRVVNDGAEPKLKYVVDHVYDMGHGILTLSRNVAITGQTSQKRTYKSVIMSRRLGGGIKVDGLLQAEAPLRDRLNQGRSNTVVWKDDKGQIIAVETRLQRDKDNNVLELPRLSIKASIEEKLYDLLVTCWCGSVWKEAEKDLKEPLSWGKFKHIASTMPNKAPGMWYGGNTG
ncbi:hypothetical protein FAVG1_00719 [Fusarium avenaceum]|nr:hypothetical protein FAVG1_00719 [Fusarium avenaceum]